ncbi:MAG: hypothetical protein M0R73_07370 [Dehalococcoidia bacterium]|nr:hypothetical protein [Dehalococcoidia bacterium]
MTHDQDRNEPASEDEAREPEQAPLPLDAPEAPEAPGPSPHIEADGGTEAPEPAESDRLSGDDAARPPRRLRPQRRTVEPEPEYPYESNPAPVVTEQGVYGTLPAPGMTLGHLRDYDRGDRPARDQWARVAAMVLALVAGLWLVLYSAAQATSESVAVPAIERTVESMTGLGALLRLHEGEIRAGTDDPVTVPGFAAEGVSLTRQEVRDGAPGDWHVTLTERTATAIYHQGPGILSNGPDQTGASTFSTTGGARLLMDTLSEANHGRVSFLVWPLGLVALASLGAVLVLGRAFTRFSAVGFALLAAAAPAVVVSVLAIGLVAFIGSDGSDLAQETNGLAADLVRTPMRNGLTLALMGIAIVIPARIAGAIFARSQPLTAPGETTYDPAYD